MEITAPKNIIVTGKYTLEGEYVLLPSQTPYQGYYYELNGKTFAGKEFNSNSPEIIKANSNKFNPLLANPNTKDYIKASNTKLNNTDVKSIPFNPTPEDLAKPFITRYFAKKLNNTPITIKEISKDTFNELQSNTVYQTLQVQFRYDISDGNLNELDKKMPGIKAYLSSDEPDTSGKDSTAGIYVFQEI